MAKFGTAQSSTQQKFTGNYRAKDSGGDDITTTADVRIWQEDILAYSADDFGGNIPEQVSGQWSGVDQSGFNVKTDDDVSQVDFEVGDDVWDSVTVV